MQTLNMPSESLVNSGVSLSISQNTMAQVQHEHRVSIKPYKPQAARIDPVLPPSAPLEIPKNVPSPSLEPPPPSSTQSIEEKAAALSAVPMPAVLKRKGWYNGVIGGESYRPSCVYRVVWQNDLVNQ